MTQPVTDSRKPRPKPKKPTLPWKGVFALEGEWADADLTDRTSILPVLQTLEGLQVIDFVRRDIGTRGEMVRYLSRWRAELPHYSLLYLGFHGIKTEDGQYALWISDDPDEWVTVQELAGHLAGTLTHCVVYFGSCSVMNAPKQVFEDFLHATGANAVMGYKNDVPWVDSAALDLIVLSWLAEYQQLHAALNRIDAGEYKSLIKKLGFKVVRA